jgi:ATP-binding cassette subfamily D (ALD) protein 4
LASVLLMPILGDFYSAIQNRNIDFFMQTLLHATILVALLGFVKSLRSFASDRFSLDRRVAIVSRVHLNYMHEFSKEKHQLDNIDQRCTQDVKDCTDRISQLIQSVIICPFVIIFYSIYLSLFLSYLAPLFCLLYFLVGTICAATIQRLRFKTTLNTFDEDLISCIYTQQRREGEFRHQHAHCIGHVDSIRLLRGEEYERNALQSSFLSLVSNSYRLIFKLLALNMVTNFFDYYGSIGIIFFKAFEIS